MCTAQVLNPVPNKPWLLRVCGTSLLKTLRRKEKLLIISNFSFSHSVYYPLGELSAIFIKSKNCRLQALSIWKSLQFVVWERVKDYTTCNSSCITNRQVCANHNSVMLKGFFQGMFIFHQFLFMKQTYPVSILGRAIAGFAHFFQRSRIIFFFFFFFSDQCATFPH